jgi:hypothetical protein
MRLFLIHVSNFDSNEKLISACFTSQLPPSPSFISRIVNDFVRLCAIFNGGSGGVLLGYSVICSSRATTLSSPAEGQRSLMVSQRLSGGESRLVYLYTDLRTCVLKYEKKMKPNVCWKAARYYRSEYYYTLYNLQVQWR